MQKFRAGFAVFYVIAFLLLSVTVLRAAPQDASFVGSWAMTVTGGEDGGQGGGGGNRGGGGGGAQSLTINSRSATRRGAVKMPMTPPSPATRYPGQRSALAATAIQEKSSLRQH